MTDHFRVLLDRRLATTEEHGASAVEYGMLVAGIAALVVAAALVFGGNVKDVFADTCPEVSASSTATAESCR